MKIAFGNDHTGIEMKDAIIAHLEGKGHEVIDVGALSAEPSDYPDFAAKVAQLVTSEEADQGILLCGSSTGMAIVANKFPGIRCASCTDPYCAGMARKHNNANVLSIRARHIDLKTNLQILEEWLNAEFEPESRHERRITKISEIEQQIKKDG